MSELEKALGRGLEGWQIRQCGHDGEDFSLVSDYGQRVLDFWVDESHIDVTTADSDDCMTPFRFNEFAKICIYVQSDPREWGTFCGIDFATVGQSLCHLDAKPPAVYKPETGQTGVLVEFKDTRETFHYIGTVARVDGSRIRIQDPKDDGNFFDFDFNDCRYSFYRRLQTGKSVTDEITGDYITGELHELYQQARRDQARPAHRRER